MIKVKVKYLSFFQDITGKAEEYIHVNKKTVEGLVEVLEKRYGTTSEANIFRMSLTKDRLECMIVVNGKIADLKVPLKDDDEVSLLQPMAGG